MPGADNGRSRREYDHAVVGNPLSWHELVAFLSALVVSLPLGYTQLKKSHIAVDILSSKFSANTRM